MEVLLDAETDVVRKRAESASERQSLRHEAAILRRAAHPGVVRLLGGSAEDPPTELVFERAPGGDLGQHPPLTVDGAAGLGAALATTVADLHHLGVTHGRIDASHVLLDGDGRPLLCGFSQASRASGDEGAARRRADVGALARLVLERMGDRAPRRTERALRAACRPGRRTLSARWLARTLVETVPSARLPGTDGGAGEAAPAPEVRPVPAARRTHRVLVATSIGLLAMVVGTWALTHRGPKRDAAESPGACPEVDARCQAVPLTNGVLVVAGRRYAVEPGGAVAVGRWGCRAALPVLLEPGRGEVWAFSRWAMPGAPVRGRLIGRFPGATSLGVVAGRGGCDRLRVDRHGRPSATVVVRP